MPFLFAYYSMLGAAIELRHAHWLWVRDLASPDPWHICRLGSLSRHYSAADDADGRNGSDTTTHDDFYDARHVGFYQLEPGLGTLLVLVMGNAISIVQQMVMNRTELGREMRAEMEKLARKKSKA